MPQSGVVTHTAMLEPAQHTLDLIYNMEFDEALRAAQHLIDLAPAHPAGYLRSCRHLLAVAFDRHLIHSRGPCCSPNFRSLRSVPVTWPSTSRRRKLPRPPFILARCMGMQARMHFVEQQYIRALLAAKQGSTDLQQCVARAPNWYDAYAGLGTYQYVLSRVPGCLARHCAATDWHRRGPRQRVAGPGTGTYGRTLVCRQKLVPYWRKFMCSQAKSSTTRRMSSSKAWCSAIRTIVTTAIGWPWSVPSWGCGSAPARSARISWPISLRASHMLPQEWLPLLHYRLAETYVFQWQPQAVAALLRASTDAGTQSGTACLGGVTPGQRA